MQPAVLFRLRPAGPWRFGPGDGGPNRLDSLFRSDRLWSALTLAAQQLGFLDEWLDATARSPEPIVACSSLFPFQGETAFVTPPATLWPPPPAQVSAPSPVFLTKVRWSAARFVPLTLVDTILSGGRILADQWVPDPESGCLLRRDRPSTTPFRTVLRVGAAVDRITGASTAPHSLACVEFEPGAGLWGLLRFASERAQAAWGDRLHGLFQLLADTGLGGRRSAGWGQMASLQFESGSWPQLLLPKASRLPSPSSDTPSGHWLLSLFSPAETDTVDWNGGDYHVVERRGAETKAARFVAEGSVLAGTQAPVGTAVDVTSDQHAHAVYRFGIALSLRLPERPTIEAEPAIVEDAMPVETCAAPAEEPGPHIKPKELPEEPPVPSIPPPQEEPEPDAEPQPDREPEPQASSESRDPAEELPEQLDAATEPNLQEPDGEL